MGREIMYSGCSCRLQIVDFFLGFKVLDLLVGTFKAMTKVWSGGWRGQGKAFPWLVKD
jgi:hypothetical protein